ncbi:hypothetical protein PCYB_081660 [Plasmodium cynomolgi strain B]|uniref:Uncharacterized protein n=1 Tax=Plasmodium cynomolgi (strain B) TaxID=1120755 RepID=K6UUY0_PLACD|nr:hypothetical protein PCYB_081660 [Plasmodium cynomolgi strain B]GAB66005.1 hypothetical protein PCYB_081660 [Plasmodium cynomolgi strain B]
MNSKKKLNIVEKKCILEKVHILPIKRKVENADALYRKLQLLINDKCVLYEGFIIDANGEKETVPGEKSTRTNLKESVGEPPKEGLTNDKGDPTKNEKHTTSTKLLEKLSSAKEGPCPNGDDSWEVAHRKESNSHTPKKNSNEKDNKNTPNNDHICLHEKCNKDKLTEETSHFKEGTDYYVVGILTRDTLIYTDGKYVDNLKKIHLIIIRDKYYKKYEKKLKKNFFL